MARLTFIVGLPGSGKTRFIHEFTERGTKCFDDFKSRGRHDSCRFDHSRYLGELAAALWVGYDCLIADIDFCRVEARDEAVALLRRWVPDVEIEWRCYDNAPTRCRRNLLADRSDSLARDLEALEKYASLYTYPDGCTPIPIRCEPSTSDRRAVRDAQGKKGQQPSDLPSSFVRRMMPTLSR